MLVGVEIGEAALVWSPMVVDVRAEYLPTPRATGSDGHAAVAESNDTPVGCFWRRYSSNDRSVGSANPAGP